MTREEAIRIATGLRTDFKCESDTMVDFCNTIIKALKQEPCEAIRGSTYGGVSWGGIYKLQQEPCEDAISRQAVLDIVSGYKQPLESYIGSPDDSEIYAYARGLLLSIERNLNALQPSVSTEKTGRWIDKDDKSAVCSCCNRNNTLYGNFCKWCGAKMEVEE